MNGVVSCLRSDGRMYGWTGGCCEKLLLEKRKSRTRNKNDDKEIRLSGVIIIITKLKVKSAGANNNYTRGTNTQGKIEMVNKS